MKRYVVGISGASGVILSHRLISALGNYPCEIELVMTRHASYTAAVEMGLDFATPAKFLQRFPEPVQEKIRLYYVNDAGAAIASGSYHTDGMIVVPCSMATIAAVAMGLADNLLRRAADVTIKERRPLIVVPRETPLNPIHLENMLKLSRLGVVILPPVPAWYQGHNTLEDAEWYIVGKILDALQLDHALYHEWVGSQKLS